MSLTPLIIFVEISYESEGCIIIDADEYKATVFCWANTIEAMTEEIDRMDAEIEMEEVEELSIVDI